MKIIEYPDFKDWKTLLSRPALDNSSLTETVTAVLDDIKSRGDVAVKEYELKFDKVQPDSLQVSEAELAEAETLWQTS